jgi:Arc/MetJ family transcription regulator
VFRFGPQRRHAFTVLRNNGANLHIAMCGILHIAGGAAMATNLAIDGKLINEARRIGKHKTKKEAVSAALKEYVDRRKQLEILKLSGTIDYDPTYDYKKMRRLDRIEIDR